MAIIGKIAEFVCMCIISPLCDLTSRMRTCVRGKIAYLVCSSCIILSRVYLQLQSGALLANQRIAIIEKLHIYP
jgi:hypothetical protein